MRRNWRDGSRCRGNDVSGILEGKRAITGETALDLGRFFGTSGEFWLNLQKLYQLRRADQRHGAVPGSDRHLEFGTATD